MALDIIQISLAILLVAAVLIQQKGTGIGSAFGGSSGMYYTRRGLEQSVHIATIVLAVLFLGTALLRFVF